MIYRLLAYLSGLPAIRYMDKLECITLEICRSYIFSGYVDDILIITHSKDEATNICQTSNNIDTNINFETELPD